MSDVHGRGEWSLAELLAVVVSRSSGGRVNCLVINSGWDGDHAGCGIVFRYESTVTGMG